MENYWTIRSGKTHGLLGGLRDGCRCRSTCLVLRDQFANLWNKINRHFEGRMSGGFKCSFVLGYGFFVALRVVVIENPFDSALIPPGWKVFTAHGDLLRLRRSALFALGPSSYAVITKTEFGMGSGTYTTRK